MLYTLISDHDRYLSFHFDQEQIDRLIGEIGDDTIEKRIDINGTPQRYRQLITELLSFSFPTVDKEDKGKSIPDLEVFQGRLFLSQKAHDALASLIGADGEFLPVTYENGRGYFYTPLRVAEDVNALNEALTRRNEWGDIEHISFKEENVKDWNLFRTEYDGFYRLFCQSQVKIAIEEAGLTGLYITNDLGNMFPQDYGAVAPLN